MPEKKISDELAELAEAVRELRDGEVAEEIRRLRAEIKKLRADRDRDREGEGSGCRCRRGCGCRQVCWYYVPSPYPYYVTTTCNTTASGYSCGNATTLSITTT